LVYGEVFCRVEDYSKSKNRFSTTNNLRTYIQSHADFKKDDESVASDEKNKGGRVSQETVDEAGKWYKSLFRGVDPVGSLEPTTPQDRSASAAPETPGTPSRTAISSYNGIKLIPGQYLLPMTKDGRKQNITVMRKLVPYLKDNVPCKSCASTKECCKNINNCNNFLLFDCGKIGPAAATSNDKDTAGADDDVI
ncbi:hypothetical protein BO71DRAFT_466275, partial [Aspergillus ellipticus CBS 707.79]